MNFLKNLFNNPVKKKYHNCLKIIEQQNQEIIRLENKIENDRIKVKYGQNLLARENATQQIVDAMSELSLQEKEYYLNEHVGIQPIRQTLELPRAFQTLEDAKKWAFNLYSDWQDKYKKMSFSNSLVRPFINELPNNSSAAINRYCGYDHQHINSLLRKTFTGSINQIHHYESITNQLTFSFLTAPRINQSLSVYRYIDEQTFLTILVDYKNTGYYQEAGFLSTTLINGASTDNNESYQNHQYLLKIYVPKNSLAIFPSLISGREFELEMLFPNNSVLKPVKKPYYDETIDKIVLECEYLNLIDHIDYQLKITFDE